MAHELQVRQIESETPNEEICKAITDLKRSEDDLRLARERLSAILETLPISPYTCKAEGGFRITYVGPAIKEITEYKPEQFIGDPAFWAEHIHPEVRDGIHGLH